MILLRILVLLQSLWLLKDAQCLPIDEQLRPDQYHDQTAHQSLPAAQKDLSSSASARGFSDPVLRTAHLKGDGYMALVLAPPKKASKLASKLRLPCPSSNFGITWPRDTEIAAFWRTSMVPATRNTVDVLRPLLDTRQSRKYSRGYYSVTYTSLNVPESTAEFISSPFQGSLTRIHSGKPFRHLAYEPRKEGIERFATLALWEWKRACKGLRSTASRIKRITELEIHDPTSIQVIEAIPAEHPVPGSPHRPAPHSLDLQSITFEAADAEFNELLGTPSGEWAAEMLFRNKRFLGVKLPYTVRLFWSNLGSQWAYGLVWEIGPETKAKNTEITQKSAINAIPLYNMVEIEPGVWRSPQGTSPPAVSGSDGGITRLVAEHTGSQTQVRGRKSF